MSVDIFVLLSACTPIGLVVHQPSEHHVQVRRDDGTVVAEWWPSNGTTMAGGVRGPKCATEAALIEWMMKMRSLAEDIAALAPSCEVTPKPTTQRGMTDDEAFTAICADFPFDSTRLDALRERLSTLHTRVALPATRDGTIDAAGVFMLRNLERAMRDLVSAMRALEGIDDDIPF